MSAGDAIAALRDRARSYPPDRYPVQHATAQFHLGLALSELGRLEEAEQALATALGLFDRHMLPAEYATASNALGAVQRAAGALDAAADAFRGGLEGFERAGRPVERAAALYNLGLVESQRSRPGDAASCFEEARRTFEAEGQPGNAAAAGRELGGALLATGELEGAAAALEDAVRRSERLGDMAGTGGAANLLGLVHLAADRPGLAVDAFRRAAAAHPRRLRPEMYAVAKANLALASHRCGDRSRALLAAGQALAVPSLPEAARDVALEALRGESLRPGALGDVLLAEPPDDWPGLVRDELDRWLDLEAAVLAEEAAAWVDVVVCNRRASEQLLAAWFGVVLELPSAAMESLLRAVLRALRVRGEDEQGEFRRAAARAMAVFAAPQLLRLHDTIERLAAEAGVTGSWR